MNRVEPNRNVYIGHRYVPLLVGEWDKSIQYEGLSIVTYKGSSYTSKKMTPPGIDIENEEYWVVTGNYNAQVEYYRQDVQRVKEDMSELDDRLTKDLSDTRQYVDDESASARQYVDDETASARQYVDDETASARQYVDNSVAENKEYVNDITEQTLDEVRTHAINIDNFGAISLDIDETFDNSDAISNALTYAYENGISDILIPNKEYGISNPITLHSGQKIKTQYGAFKILSNSDWVINNRNRGVIEIVGVNNCEISNLRIEGSPLVENNPSNGILLMNTHSNKFENVHLKNLGSKTSYPSSGVLRAVARDSVTEFDTSTPEIYSNVTGAVKDNTFSKCTIENEETFNSAFGARLLTDWVNLKQRDNVENNMENNNFIECKFIGNYHWNHLEFAGSGTINNTVRDCYFTGNSLTAIDFDKGASFNTADNNYIENVGLPSELIDDNNLHLAVIHVHGAGDGIFSDGNIVKNNKIFSSDNAVTRSHSINASVLALAHANDNIFSNNIINGLNNGVQGNAFHIGHESTNNVFLDNNVKNVHTGLTCNFNSSTHSNNKIKGNNFYELTRGLIYSGVNDSKLRGVEITDNTIYLNNHDDTRGIQVSAVALSPVIRNNTVYNGMEGIQIIAPFALIEGNIVIDSGSRSFRITSVGRSTLINNVSINPVTDDLIYSNDIPVMSNNIFNRSPRNGGIETFNNEPPTTGKWNRSDKVYAETPRSGSFIGWICLEGGTPGTWKGFGLIEE